jgi:hypothetical protein
MKKRPESQRQSSAMAGERCHRRYSSLACSRPTRSTASTARNARPRDRQPLGRMCPFLRRSRLHFVTIVGTLGARRNCRRPGLRQSSWWRNSTKTGKRAEHPPQGEVIEKILRPCGLGDTRQPSCHRLLWGWSTIWTVASQTARRDLAIRRENRPLRTWIPS